MFPPAGVFTETGGQTWLKIGWKLQTGVWTIYTSQYLGPVHQEAKKIYLPKSYTGKTVDVFISLTCALTVQIKPWLLTIIITVFDLPHDAHKIGNI